MAAVELLPRVQLALLVCELATDNAGRLGGVYDDALLVRVRMLACVLLHIVSRLDLSQRGCESDAQRVRPSRSGKTDKRASKIFALLDSFCIA
jgi:hypothetical protein